MMHRKMVAVWVSLALVFGFVVLVDIVNDITPPVKAETLYVNTTGLGGAYTNIQDAINVSNNGDTVFVYNGTYYENVVVNKTINLTGENRDNTIIDGGGNGDVVYVNGLWMNITGFTITNSGSTPGDAGIELYNVQNSSITENNVSNNDRLGIYLISSSYNNISGNNASNNLMGISISNSDNNTISNNTALDNDYGIYLSTSTNNTIIANEVFNNNFFGILIRDFSNNNAINSNNVSLNKGDGIIIYDRCRYNTILKNTAWNNTDDGIIISLDSAENVIMANNASDNKYGISIYSSSIYNTVIGNNATNNEYGIHISYSSDNNIIIYNNISNNDCGIYIHYSLENIILNCTIINSTNYDIYLEDWAYVTTLNTSFNRSKVYFEDTNSELVVKWFLHIYVNDTFGNPVSGANVNVQDNSNGTFNVTNLTAVDGWIRWWVITEHLQDQTATMYYTPHRIIAWNETLVGYAYPEPIMNKSKTINITLDKGTFMDLEHGWNLISFSRILLDIDPQTILQSIEGRYDSVQWYNITDKNDPWKHYHVSKQSYMNDLNVINHTMGFWIHTTDTAGTKLVVFGEMLTYAQNITLYSGWNMVGYPSLTSFNRTVGLNNLTFGTDVDCIQWYDAFDKTWHFMSPDDNFVPGRGYWVHSMVEAEWEVPL